MLYVFQVDTGTMITFDMNLALNSVSCLQEAIWQNNRIPVDRQVLLVSGGECLDPSARVCFYSAGTDTNPIFLFNKSNIESSPTSSGQHVPGSGSLENLSDIDAIKDQIKGCMDLPATYMTVVTRSQLAQQLMELAKDLLRRCEQLIHDQHLQHQGWAAVVANLEDIVIAFRQKADNFETQFLEHLRTKDDRLATLTSFEKDVQELRNIPILPSLIDPNDPKAAGSSNMSILDWIISHDSNKLETLSAQCYKGFEKLDASIIEALQKEKKSVIEKADNPSMKEIKGLEDRFYALDQLLNEAKEDVRSQCMQAQAFLNNQNSANNERDLSILPDLCSAHQLQLMTMFKKHQHLDEIRRKCAKAKEELIGNLNSRLKWIIYVQHSLTETSNKLSLYSESLRRLRNQIEIVEQIHVAAPIYGEAVIEVLRRKKFSEAYTKWANTIANAMDQIHSDEIERRKKFATRFEGHFLSALFTGFEDFRPYITMRISPFDINLPEVQDDEVKNLREAYSALPPEEELPDFSIDIACKPSVNEENARNALELENVNIKVELEKIKFEVQTRNDEIQRLLGLHNEEKEALLKNADEKVAQLTNKINEQNSKVSELEHTLSCKQQELLETISTREKEMEELKSSMQELEQMHRQKITEMTEQYEATLMKSREELLIAKESELKGVRDQHKADLEGLRSRYKLMASFDQRSPSDLQEKSFDSFEKPAKNDDVLQELHKIADSASQNTDKSVSTLLQSLILKLEGTSLVTLPHSPGRGDKSPMSLRSRGHFSSDEGLGSRASIEAEDEIGSANVKSVYGLDTSAIDASSLCTSDESDPNSAEIAEMLTPPTQIVTVAKFLLKGDQITASTVKIGEHVLIYYNSRLQSHLVYSSSKSVVFLHTDCLKSLDHSLESPVGAFTAEIMEKEFCVARRRNNRYRVPQGFRFHRVKVKVLQLIDVNNSEFK